MADTDIPGFGGLDFPTSPPRLPRPIASPFGALASPPGLSDFQPPSAPGFNAGVPSPAGWLPPNVLSNLAANLTPSRQDIAETLGGPADQLAPARVAENLGSALLSHPGANYWTPPNRWTPVAEILGAPVDAMALTLRHLGLPISGETQPNGSWRPSVPLGTKSIQDSLNTLDNVRSPISLDSLWYAIRRHGLF